MKPNNANKKTDLEKNKSRNDPENLVNDLLENLSTEDIIKGIIFSEILSKPKAMRKKW